MPFDFRRMLRHPAYLVSLSSALAACGGGSGVTDESTNSASAASVTASVNVGASSIPVVNDGTSDSAAGAAGADAATKAIVAPVLDASGASPDVTVAMAAVTDPTSGSVVSAPAETADANGYSVPLSSVSTPPRSGVGLNVSGLTYFSTAIPTIDVMKRASAWLTQCASTKTCANFAAGAGSWDTLEEAALDLDADGYPKSLPADDDLSLKFRKVTTMLSSSGSLPAGRYIVAYDGAGTITYGGAAVKSATASKPGRDVVDLGSGSTASFWLTIAATQPGNHLRNIRVYLPGGACASNLQTFAADAASCGGSKGAFVPFESFPKDNLWNPQFLADVKGFRTLRFMDWGATNSNLLSSWSSRPQVTNRIWSSTKGVPVEAMLSLANVAGADPWISLPAHVDDDYVLQFSRLATQTLSTSLKVNLEYGNEPWNYAFKATQWMLAQAQAAWPDEVAKGTNIWSLESNWYAQRLVNVCRIAKGSSSAAASRFRCISNTQAAQPSQTEQVLACTVAARTLGQPCAKWIDAAAIAPYFGYYLGGATARPVVSTWYAQADGGLNALFQELTGHDLLGKILATPLATLSVQAPGGALAQSLTWMKGTKAVTAKYGVPMWAYEGGQHLVAPAGDTDAKLSTLMIAANRDARMQGAYEQMIANWKSAGGQTFTYYSHAGLPSKSGSWGMKESMADNGNAKWKAAVEQRNASCWWSGC